MQKKIIHLSLVAILLLQFFLPQVVVAQTLLEQSSSIKLNQAELEANSTKENARVKLNLGINTEEETKASIAFSSALQLDETTPQVLKDVQGNDLGTYVVTNNLIYLTIKATSQATAQLTLAGKMSENNSEDQVTVTNGSEKQTFSLPAEWLTQLAPATSSTEIGANETGNSEEGSQQATATPNNSNTDKYRREPVNIKDIYKQLNLPDDYLQNMNLTFTDQDGNFVTEPTIGDTIHFEMKFKLNEEVRKQMQEGDYYVIQMPDTVKFGQNQKFPLNDDEGNHYADVVIDTNGKITIVFTNEIENASNISGDFNFQGNFNKEEISGPGDTEIVPGDNEDLGATVTIKPNYTGDNIDKKGHFDKEQNPNNIIWNVDVNKAMDHLTNAKVTEDFPKGTKYQSVKVYRVKVDFDGNVIDGSEELVDPSEYTVDSNGTVQFKNEIKDTYRLEYTTSIDEEMKPDKGGPVDFINHATLNSDGLKDATAEASVSTMYGQEIQKNKNGYHAENQTVDWTINYNYGEKSIPNGTIKDTFGDSKMFLVDGSVKLYEVTFDPSGKPIRGNQLIEGVDYQLDSTDGKGFTIHFLHEVKTAIDIDYTTGYDGIINENTPIKNSVVTETGEESSGSGDLTPQNVVKSLGDVDYEAKIANWSIDININKYDMNNWQLTDTLSDGLALKIDTVKIFDNDMNKYLVLGQDYTFTYDPGANQFKIKFIGSYLKTNHTFKITYATDFDPEKIPEEDGAKKFTNNVDVEWKTDDGKTIDDHDHAEFKPNEPTKYNGSKSGSYNAQTKEITWTIAVDYLDETLKNATLTDQIPSDQTYEKDSVKVFHYSVNTEGKILKGDELTAAEYQQLKIQQPTVGNDQTLSVNFPDGKAGRYLIELKTNVKEMQVNATYDNDAIFSNDQYEDHSLHGEVAVNHGGEFGEKTGKQDEDGFVNWSITLNGSQSTLNKVKLVDTPSVNQAIDSDSLHIYKTSVAVDGTIAVNKEQELIKNQDYSVNLTTNNDTGQQEMTINLINDYETITQPLIIEYRTMVLFNGDETSGNVSNDVHITSEGDTHIDNNTGGNTEVGVTEGGGTIHGERGRIVLEKVGENDEVLPAGATFELRNEANTQVLRTGTVGEDGKITFASLPFGNYILKETGALTDMGYTIDSELVAGKKIIINDTTTKGVPVVIQNKLARVQLMKQNEQGEPLAGAKFKLEEFDENNNIWVQKILNQSLTTDAKGQLTIEGLTVGKYRLTETKAPAGYILNTNSIQFEVQENSSHQLVQVGMNSPFVNYQAGISFVKKDDQGKPLVGAEFALYKSEDLITPVAKATSDEAGKVNFKHLGPGNYQIQETKAPEGYILNTEMIENVIVPEQADQPVGMIQLGADFINYQGAVAIKKYGAAKDGKQPLAGVGFALKDEQNQLVKTGTTDENGQLVIEGLKPGTYYFEETNVGPNQDFMLNTEQVKVIVPNEEMGRPTLVTAEMTDYQGSFKMKKVNGHAEGLAGAEFSLFTKSRTLVASGLTSDADGMINYQHLAPGEYYLTETKAPVDEDGHEYIKNEYPIQIIVPKSHQGAPEVIDLGEFQNYKGKIAVTKIGAGDLPIVGAKFALYEGKGSQEELVQIAGKDYTEVGADGHIEIDGLEPGDYKLVEIEAPTDYVINTQPIYFTVTEEENEQPPVENVSVMNYELGIEAIKLDDSQKIPVPLTGAEFQVHDEKGQVVSVYNEDKQLTQTVMTDEQGQVFAKGLKAGHYTLVETKAPEGYILDTEEHPFDIEDTSGKPEHITLDLGSIENYHGSIKVKKQSPTGEGLNGGTFEIKDATGKVMEVTDILGERTTQLTSVGGEISATGLVPGNYYLVETKAPEGYILESDQSVMPFKIASSGRGKAATIFVDNLTNYKGSVELNKVDQETKAALGGASFNLYTKAGALVKEQLTTDVAGQLSVDQLIPDDYYFVETQAPTDYELSKDKIFFTIEASAVHEPKTVELTVGNKHKPTKEELPPPNSSKKNSGFLPKLGGGSEGLAGFGMLILTGLLFGWLVRRRRMRP